jgi:hypothetical protein
MDQEATNPEFAQRQLWLGCARTAHQQATVLQYDVDAAASVWHHTAPLHHAAPPPQRFTGTRTALLRVAALCATKIAHMGALTLPRPYRAIRVDWRCFYGL